MMDDMVAEPVGSVKEEELHERLEGARYDIDMIEGAFYIFDNKNPKSAITYIMFATPVHDVRANWQLTIARYNAKKNVKRDYYAWEQEVWTTFFWAANQRMKTLIIRSVLAFLQRLDIDNPTELVNEFGGCVLNDVVPVPSHYFVH